MKPLNINILIIEVFVVVCFTTGIPAYSIMYNLSIPTFLCIFLPYSVVLILYIVSDGDDYRKVKIAILNMLPKKVDKTTNSYIFYVKKKMPCCGKKLKFREGPGGGGCTNIMCSHCGQRWNIVPMFRDIDKIQGV